jgi:hypothetical protein
MHLNLGSPAAVREQVPRSTEGMILSSQFPSNYFSVSEVEQFFDDFGDEFKGEPGRTGCSSEERWGVC